MSAQPRRLQRGHEKSHATASHCESGQPTPKPKFRTKWTWRSKPAGLQSSGQQGPWSHFLMSTSWGLCPLRIQLHPLALASLPGPHRPPSTAAHQEPTGGNRQGSDMRHPLDLPSQHHHWSHRLLLLLEKPYKPWSGPPPAAHLPANPGAHSCSQPLTRGTTVSSNLGLPHAARTIHTYLGPSQWVKTSYPPFGR